jgi:uncharacterized protein YndB with AHSA1/START domain
MRTFTKTVDIDAPPERVWKIMVDVERWPEWTRSVKSVRRLDGGPLAVGSRARISQAKLLPAVWTVTHFDASRSFTWSAAGPGFRVSGRHSVEAVASGSRVTLTLQFDGLFGSVVARLLRKLNLEYMDLEAAGLKRRSEDGSAAKPTR